MFAPACLCNLRDNHFWQFTHNFQNRYVGAGSWVSVFKVGIFDSFAKEIFHFFNYFFHSQIGLEFYPKKKIPKLR